MMDKIFSRNEHPWERVIRVLVGLGLMAMVFIGPRTPWGYLGLIPFVTGLTGNCPLYSLLGINTCRTSPKG